jgi:tetratricopeptide (TPR) repeat protein
MNRSHPAGLPAVPALVDAELIAEALRPFQAYASTLALVVDDSPSMSVWSPTAGAFRDVVSTAFAEVNAYRLGHFRGRATTREVPAGQLIVVLSDGLDDYWGHRAAAELLQGWGRTVPVAIVNPYPQERWYRTHLAPRLLQLSAPRAMSPNAELQIREPAQWKSPFDEPLHEAAVVVPLLELTPRWLGWWASLLGQSAHQWVDAVAYIADPDRTDDDDPAPGKAPADGPSEPQDLVFQFRAEASAQAFRLATYAASAPLELPALRIVQGALLPDSRPVHLAELITSPLLVANPAQELAFRPGVREALLSCAARDDTVRVIEVLSTFYGDRAPAVQGLLRALQSPDEIPDTRVTADSLSFAMLELAVLRALSGPYVLRAARLNSAIAEFEQPSDPTTAETPAAAPEGWRDPMPDQQPLTRPDAPFLPARPDPMAATRSINALLTGQEADARETLWGNVPPRNADFTGREELLLALEQRLLSRSVAAVLPQAMHGSGGVGKSQIAAEYAYRHRSDYDVVWWIPAEQPAQILRSLIELGERLGLDVGPEANTAVPAVQKALQAGAPYPMWLLIFDNAETIDTVRPYLPHGGTGKVLVTSRNDEWTEVADTLQIDVFSRAESIALLRKRNPTISVHEADRLAEVLEDLPLAIGQATAWQATTHMPVEDYLRLLNEKRAQLAEQGHDEGYEIAVAAAWTVALERIGVENPAALLLLQTCSFMAPEPISQELFIGTHNLTIFPEMDKTLQNPSRVGRAIRDIERYGLARIDYREGTIQLHRLVRTVVVAQLSGFDQVQMQHAAHLLLAGGNPGAPSKPGNWPRFHALLPHVLASDAVSCEDAWARQLLLDIIEFYYYWGDQIGCRDLSQQVVDRWTTMLEPHDSQILKAARWLGYGQRLLGNFADAARINADCLEKLRVSAGPDDEETLDAMGRVAADLRAGGDFNESLRLDQEALEISQEVFGPDYPHTLNMAHSVGVSLRLVGDFSAALDRDADTLRRRTEVLGADHPLTFLTLNGLTLDLRESGAYIQANIEQERLYERIQRSLDLSLDHPQMLTAARNLAVSRRRAGDHDRARKLALDTMNRLRQRFGELNPEAIACALNYAVDLRENDELEKSLALAQRTHAEYEQTLGPVHPYTLYARTNLAIVLRLLGQTDLAFRHNSAAFEQLSARLGRDHVLTLTCAVNLASDRAAQGDHEGARELDADTLNRSRERLGADHPSTLAGALNLSIDLTALGQTHDGERLFREVVTAYRRVLGAEHPAIVAAYAGQRANCDVDPMPL